MDFGDLLEYLGPLAFLLIAFLNNFFKKKKPIVKPTINKVNNEPKNENKNFKDLFLEVKKEINSGSLPKSEVVIEKTNIIPEKIKDFNSESKNDEIPKSIINQPKKVNNYKKSIKEKLRDKNNLKDAFVLKEILEKKF